MRFLVRPWIVPAVMGITMVVASLAVTVAVPAQSSATRTYLVLYSGQADAQRAPSAISAMGGTTVAVYDKLGMAFARSNDGSFKNRMRQIPGVIAVAATDRHVWRNPARDSGLQSARGPEDATGAGQADTVGSLTARQWDMKLIHATEAHAVTLGSRNVVVGVIDTGIDYTHPNLAANIDFGRSVSCVGGTPNSSPAAWNDDAGHGTHVAGTIAASSAKADGLGIDGVAPGVRVAAIKTGDADGNFMLEAVVCAFTWAADHHINVTNNSYFSDPWLYHCMNDPEQKAIWTAEKRALNYAVSKGVTVVAAAGNFNDDLENPTIDVISPDFGPTAPYFRDVSEDCFTFPSMVPGVITVSSVGMTKNKSYYSSFGTGYVKVTAPGGDRRVFTPENPNGRILSTVPSWFPGFTDCTPAGKCGRYAWFQGTSMASPHVAGVAALILSRNDGEEDGGLNNSAVLARLQSTADPLACPTDQLYPTVLSPTFGAAADALIPPSVQREPAQCDGSSTYNNFYGSGLINALRAVSER